MPTALTLLFPDGYALGNGGAAGRIDQVQVYDESGNSGPVFDGSIASNGTLFVRGWGLDATRGLPAAGILVTLGDAVVEAVYGDARTDIAELYGDGRLAKTGFRATISPGASVTGPAELRAYVVSSDAREITHLGGSTEIHVVRGDAAVTFDTPMQPGLAAYAIDAWNAVPVAERSPAHDLLVVKRGTLVALSGWAIDAAAQRPVRGVYLIVDGCDVIRGSIGRRRDDVAAEFGSDALLAAGFEIRFDTTGLASGVHRLSLGMVSWDGAAHDRVELRQRLEVLPALRP
jgi:hypothetical protein